MNKAERVKKTSELFIKTLDYYQNTNFGFDKSILERMKENGDFYSGVGQWPEDVKQQLRSEYRPALVINRCAPIINMNSGYEIQNRIDIKPYAFESGDANYAFLMEYVLKHVHRYYDWQFTNSEGYVKGIVSSEANWEYSIDIGDDGYPTLERDLLSVGSVLWDPLSLRYDRKDAMFCFHNSWIRLDELLQLKPKLDGKKLENMPDVENALYLNYDRYDFAGMNNHNLFDKVNNKVRLIRLWQKHWETEYVVYDKKTREIRRMDEAEIKGIDIENPTFDIRPRMKSHISYHMVSGEEELAKVDNINLTRIPIIPFYCFFYEGMYFSIIDLAKDRQMQINKTDSIMHDYLSRLPKLSAMAEESAFINEADRDRFDRARVGDSFVFADGAIREGKVQIPNIRGLEIITYYSALKQQMNAELKETTGAQDTLQGIKPKGAQSGVAFDILRSQGLTIIEPILNNYYRTQRLMGQLEIEMIQKFFPPEKIERILGTLAQNFKDDKLVEIWEQARDDEEMRAKLVETLMTSNYDILVDKGLNTPTIKQANQVHFRELMASGFPVPPDLIIENSDVSQDQKELWKMFMKQQMPQGTT